MSYTTPHDFRRGTHSSDDLQELADGLAAVSSGSVVAGTGVTVSGTWPASTIGLVNPNGNALEDILVSGLGFQSWNFHPNACSGNSALTSQTVYAVAVPYRAGQIVSNIDWIVQTAAAGTTPTYMGVGLATSSAMLRSSGNLNASALWTTTGLKEFALSSSYTITVDGVYYHLVLQNGAFGTTQPQLGKGAALGLVRGASSWIAALAGTAVASLGADASAITLAASGLQFFSGSS